MVLNQIEYNVIFIYAGLGLDVYSIYLTIFHIGGGLIIHIPFTNIQIIDTSGFMNSERVSTS